MKKFISFMMIVTLFAALAPKAFALSEVDKYKALEKIRQAQYALDEAKSILLTPDRGAWKCRLSTNLYTYVGEGNTIQDARDAAYDKCVKDGTIVDSCRRGLDTIDCRPRG